MRLSASSLYRPQEWLSISLQVCWYPVACPHSQQKACAASAVMLTTCTSTLAQRPLGAVQRAGALSLPLHCCTDQEGAYGSNGFNHGFNLTVNI